MEESANQQVIQQPQPSVHAPSGMPRMAMIAGIIVLMALIGIGGYVLGTKNNHQNPGNRHVTQMYPTTSQQVSPTVSQTSPSTYPTTSTNAPSDWKTYTSSKYNYSVKYPSNLEADDKQSSRSTIFNIIQTQPGPSGFPTYYVSVIPQGFTNSDVSVYNFLSQSDIDLFYAAKVGDVIDSRKGQTYSEFWTYKRLPDMTIDGNTALVVENSKIWEGGQGMKDRRLFIKRAGSTYEIGAYYTSDADFNNFQTFLGSFKLQ